MGNSKTRTSAKWSVGFYVAATALVAVLSVSALPSARASSLEEPAPKAGLIDLHGYRFDERGGLALKGEWLLSWDKLLAPKPWAVIKTEATGLIPVPGNWNALTLSDKFSDSSAPLSAIGKASYVLRVVNHSGPLPGFKIPGISSAARVFYVTLQGEVFAQAQVGTPGTSAEGTVPVPHAIVHLEPPQATSLPLETLQRDGWYVLLHISNYHDNSGGIWNSAVFDSGPSLSAARVQTRFRAAVMFGVLLIIGSYHLVLFAQRRDDLSALFFALFCLSIGARTFAMSIGQSLGLSTSIDAYQFMQSVEYASMPVMMATAMYFIEAVLPGRWFRNATHFWALGLGTPLLLLAMFATKSTFGSVLIVYQVHILGTLVIVLIYLVQGSLRGNQLARWCILAFLLVAFGAVNDILHSNDIIESTHIAPYTMIGFVLMQAGILSARNASIARERDALNATKLEVLQKSEEAARIKSEFLANMSHELRTPLNALCNIPRALIANYTTTPVWECPACKSQFEDDGGLAEDMAAPSCPECGQAQVTRRNVKTYVGDQDEQHRYLESVDLQAQSLLGLVERVLTFNDVTRQGDHVLDLSSVNLNETFNPLFEHFRQRAEARFVTLDVTIDGAVVEVDRDKVEQCLDLILDNAIKFTVKYGEIHCTLEAMGTSQLKVTVRDTGIGIASSDLERIFDPFYQVESSHTREFGGAGLGLALVKELSAAHHGSVSVVSTVGEGSTFTVHFSNTLAKTS